MTPPIPTTEPTTAAAGDTWRWRRAFAAFPASEGWVLVYAIRGISALAWQSTWLGADGETVTIPADKTAALLPGTYRWSAFMTKGGERHTVDSGVLTVTVDLAQAAPGDAQSHAEQMLAQIEAQIAELLSTPIDSYSIQQRSVQKRKLQELRELRNYYRSELRASKRRGKLGRPVAVVFRRPS